AFQSCDLSGGILQLAQILRQEPAHEHMLAGGVAVFFLALGVLDHVANGIDPAIHYFIEASRSDGLEFVILFLSIPPSHERSLMSGSGDLPTFWQKSMC